MSTSLAVSQFFDLATGRRKVSRPANGFRVAAVFPEQRVCLTCYGKRIFDVVYARSVRTGRPVEVMRRCRSCRQVTMILVKPWVLGLEEEDGNCEA
jgi:hypothetical protein